MAIWGIIIACILERMAVAVAMVVDVKEGFKRASSGVGGVAKNQVAQLTWRAFRGLMVIHWRVGTGQG